jgi:hypothetical protein
VVGAPQELGARAGDGAGGELLEAAEEVAVAARGVPGEVVGAGVHLLQERGLRVDQPVVLEDPVDLGDHLGRIQYVLQYRLRQHRVDARRAQWNPVGVRDELGHRARDDVEADDLDARIAVDGAHTVADRGPADDQQCRRRAREAS